MRPSGCDRVRSRGGVCDEAEEVGRGQAIMKGLGGQGFKVHWEA